MIKKVMSYSTVYFFVTNVIAVKASSYDPSYVMFLLK